MHLVLLVKALQLEDCNRQKVDAFVLVDLGRNVDDTRGTSLEARRHADGVEIMIGKILDYWCMELKLYKVVVVKSLADGKR